MTNIVIEQIDNNLNNFTIDILVEYYLNLNKESKVNFLSDFYTLLEKYKFKSLNVDFYNEDTITINDTKSLDSMGIVVFPTFKDEQLQFRVSINKSEFGIESNRGCREGLMISKEIIVTHDREASFDSVSSVDLITQVYGSNEDDYALDYRNEYIFNTKKSSIQIDSESTKEIFHELVEELQTKKFINKDFFEVMSLKHDFKSDFISNNLIDFLNKTNYKNLISKIEEVNKKKVKNEHSTNSKRRI